LVYTCLAGVVNGRSDDLAVRLNRKDIDIAAVAGVDKVNRTDRWKMYDRRQRGSQRAH
jgi:hypothetical protein